MREMATSIRGLKNISVELGHVVEGNNDVYAEGVFLSEMIGAPPRVDGTPMRTDFRFVAVVEMADGLIARLTEYFDTKPLKPLGTPPNLFVEPPLALLGRCRARRGQRIHDL